ncbi:MAG: hypothetical protein HYX65_10680 [Gemmatimonadetes bacterium]|nr:hypothetical protein [Gemmatimonadota bacterium]
MIFAPARILAAFVALGALADGPSWTGTIAALADGTSEYSVGGTASMTAGGPRNAIVSISVAHGVPGQEYAWSLYRGACGDDTRAVAPTGSYSTLVGIEGGDASAIAEFNFAVPTSGAFHVSVATTGQNAGLVVGCANLELVQGK